MDGQERKAPPGRAGRERADHRRHEDVPPAGAAWRYPAGRHPRPPARALVGMERDTESTQDAARRPGPPVAVTRRTAGEAREGGAG
ncbi:hypothetical protein JCM4814A_90860 [Streptomyces phaeofaciens JCM 4814]|uniref:Uncharacterized protein n=1 Tax=Streptomyces phaeofaciens TaxID=68254 RepID=A0A918HC04_9ACTN|nr:hypothetical protein [Streptomyces phaeofaciens]GGT51366.1 hypothetical protein GCM10010226_30670 [Streptomyces phaeofaciens]